MNKNAVILGLMMLILIAGANAQVAISSFSSNPSVILPGKQVTLSITLENVGDVDVDDVVVKLDLANVPFAPVNSASEKVIDEINEDDTTSVDFQLVALPDAASQIYKIPVKVSYSGLNQDSLISLSVSGQARLDVVLESSEVVKVGDRGNVIIKFVNNGLTDLKFLTVKLNSNNGYELLTSDTIYIGEVDMDDFETAEFEIITRQADPELFFTVEYKDAGNKDYSQSKLIKLNVYSLEEAKQLGLIATNITGMLIAVVVAVLVAFFVYRRYKRKKLKI